MDMNNIYFTSDLHFGHNREFIYSSRGFSSIEEHDKQIISNWNSIIDNNDIVYVLGDLMMSDNEYGMSCLKQLKGNIRVIRGNHDSATKWELYKTLDNFELIGWAEVIKYRKHNIYLSHHPTITTNAEKTTHLREYLLSLFGHTHSKDKFYNNIFTMYNVALDANNNLPVHIEDILKSMRNKRDEITVALA